MSGVVVHLKGPDALKPELSGRHLRLYRRLQDICAKRDVPFQTKPRDADIRIGTRTIDDDRFNDGHLHILDDRSVQAPNVLNASASYFWDFWHLDPKGTKAFSSIGARDYNPREMSYRWSKTFFDELRRKYVHKRFSKYAQPKEVETLPEGCLAVFFQGDYPKLSGATTYSDLDILRAVLNAAGDRPVVVKPHPRAAPTNDIAEAAALAQSDPRIHMTDANVHDILRACSLTASVNSSVALEGYLHRKPALLFGRSDFHHIAFQVTALEQTADVVQAALEHPGGGYANYLTWYFKRQCLWLARSRSDEMIWDKFDAAGFPLSRLKGG